MYVTEKRIMVILVASVAVLSTLPVVVYGLPWIEDSDLDEGVYSYAYAYVGAYTDGERLINIQHDWDADTYPPYSSISKNIEIVTYNDKYYRYAYTKVYMYVDPDGDGSYLLDAYAYASIEASIILSR